MGSCIQNPLGSLLLKKKVMVDGAQLIFTVDFKCFSDGWIFTPSQWETCFAIDGAVSRPNADVTFPLLT
jgi:hypothetical protein